MTKKYLLAFIMALISTMSLARTFNDKEGMRVQDFFVEKNAVYVIRFSHIFVDTLIVPSNSILKFEGGSLSGPIIFRNTELCGNVNLKHSTIGGTIKNKVFNASWICYMDGKTDDAHLINEMIEVCEHLYFPKGRYRLISEYNPSGIIDDVLLPSVKANIGICKNNVSLTGEKGTEFVTYEPLGTICIFSKPNQIRNSVRNIEISNIKFSVHNNGRDFHEFMHTIKTIGVNGLIIKDCNFNDFWGDAICLSHYGDNPETGERTRNQKVKIINNTIKGGRHFNNRNGISIINGKNVTIKNNLIKNTSKRSMPGGIDIEPNNSAYTIEHIMIENNTLDSINGSGGAIGVVSLKDGPANDITIIGNRISSSIVGININIKSEGTTAGITIKNNYVAGDTHPYNFLGEGSSKNWVITDNVFERPIKTVIPENIRVKNLKVKNNEKKRLIFWIVDEYPIYSIAVLSISMALAILVFKEIRKRKNNLR